MNRADFEARLAEEGQRIEERQLRELADKALRGSFYVDDAFKPVRFAEYVLASYSPGSFVTPVNDLGGDVVWRYNEERGIFEATGVPFVEKALLRVNGEETTTAQYVHVVKHLQVLTYTDPQLFDENPDVVVLKNGSLNVLTGELMAHSPEYKAKNAWPVAYDPAARCPTFLRFLERVIPGAEYRQFFQEWVGYHLLKDYRWQRIMVLVGDGDNGKSTLLLTLVALLGADNVSSQSLYKLATNRFSPAELQGRLANIAADIGPDELKHTGTVKMLSGNDWITAERKNRDPFKFRPYAKLSFSCNQVPQTPDETLAFYKRFIVIVTGDPVPLAEQDSQLLEKLTTPEELSGLLNWALEGLKAALERGRLSEPLDLVARRELYKRMSNPIVGFVNDCVEEDPETYTEKKEVYSAFARYCRDRGFIACGDAAFFKEFRGLVFVSEYVPRVGGRRIRALKGIRLVQVDQVVQGKYTGSLDRHTGNQIETPVPPVPPVPPKAPEALVGSDLPTAGWKGPPPEAPERSLQKDLNRLVNVLEELEKETGEAVSAADLERRIMWYRPQLDKVLGVAMKDGTVYQPRPGYYRRST